MTCHVFTQPVGGAALLQTSSSHTQIKPSWVILQVAAQSLTVTLFSFTFLTRHRPNSFVMITANRVLHCNADTPEEMHHWITLLQRSKGDTRVDGQEFIIRGAVTSGVFPRMHFSAQVQQIQ